MYKFTNEQHGSLTLACNALILEEYVHSFEHGKDFFRVDFDDYHVQITAPMKGALQFVLFDLQENLIESVVTDQVEDTLPMRRLILALISTINLASFNAGWDGYVIGDMQ